MKRKTRRSQADDRLTNNVITKHYGPFRCLFRDHTLMEDEAFLSGHALEVKVDFQLIDNEVMNMDQFGIFVVAKTDWVDQYLSQLLMNTVLVSTLDPLGNVIIILETEKLIDVRLMRDVTCKGLEKMMKEDFQITIHDQTDGVVGVSDVVVFEARFK